MRCHLLAAKGRTSSAGGHDVLRYESLQRVSTEAGAIQTGEDGFIRASFLLSQPFFENGGDIRPERRATHLPAFSETAEMGTDTELHILTSKRCNLAVTKPSLNRQ
jgi:hypothetical protein